MMTMATEIDALRARVRELESLAARETCSCGPCTDTDPAAHAEYCGYLRFFPHGHGAA